MSNREVAQNVNSVAINANENIMNQIQEDNFIGFYGHKIGPYRCFSNFYPSTIRDNNCTYICAEQFIMAKKALLFNDNASFTKILNSSLPKTIKSLGRFVRNFDENTWVQERPKIIEQCLYLKFSQHKKLKKILLSTGNKYIAECSFRDKIWGIGYNTHNALNHHPSEWGLNLLGKGLMNIRTLLRAEE
jgi:hypothetical protein